MTDTLSKILSIFLWVLLGISIVLAVVFYTGGITEETIGGAYEEPVYTDLFMLWAKILVVIAVLSAILLPIIAIISNPKGAYKTLIGIGIIAVIGLISYAMASDHVLKIAGDEAILNTPAVSKNVGAGLIASYILGIFAFGSIVFTELISRFR